MSDVKSEYNNLNENISPQIDVFTAYGVLSCRLRNGVKYCKVLKLPEVGSNLFPLADNEFSFRVCGLQDLFLSLPLSDI